MPFALNKYNTNPNKNVVIKTKEDNIGPDININNSILENRNIININTMNRDNTINTNKISTTPNLFDLTSISIAKKFINTTSEPKNDTSNNLWQWIIKSTYQTPSLLKFLYNSPVLLNYRLKK